MDLAVHGGVTVVFFHLGWMMEDLLPGSFSIDVICTILTRQ